MRPRVKSWPVKGSSGPGSGDGKWGGDCLCRAVRMSEQPAAQTALASNGNGPNLWRSTKRSARMAPPSVSYALSFS
jgi:hypothetical protein